MKAIGLAAIILLCFVTSANSQTQWANIAVSPDGDMKWDVQHGSLEFAETRGGTSIAVVVGRISNEKSSQVNLYKWYVSATDCAKKLGKVVSLGIDGEYIFENDFVVGSGTIASSMAEAICGAANYSIKEAENKSI